MPRERQLHESRNLSILFIISIVSMVKDHVCKVDNQ